MLALLLVSAWLLLLPGTATGQTLREKGLALRGAGRYEEALIAFETLARDTATDPGVIALLADAYALEGRRREAIDAAQRAISVYSCQSSAHVVLARLGTFEAGLCDVDLESAWSHLRTAVACDSTHAEAWLLLGLAAADRGDASTEREALKRAVQYRLWTPGVRTAGSNVSNRRESPRARFPSGS